MIVDTQDGSSTVAQADAPPAGVTEVQGSPSEVQGSPSEVEMLFEITSPTAPKSVSVEVISDSQLASDHLIMDSPPHKDSPIDPTLPKFVISLPAQGTVQARLVGSPEKPYSFVSRTSLPPSQRTKVKYVPKTSTLATKNSFPALQPDSNP